MRRSKAYEQLGQHKAALADMQKANRLDAATADSRVGGVGWEVLMLGGNRWDDDTQAPGCRPV